MIKNLLILILLLLAVSSSIFLYNINLELDKELEKINIDFTYQTSLLESMHDILNGQWQLSGTVISKDLALLDEERQIRKLGNVVDEETLILWFSANSCGECVKQEVSYLAEIQNETEIKVIIIGDFNKLKDLKILVREKYFLDFPIFTLAENNNTNLEFLGTDSVLLFTINSQGQITNCHIGNVSLPKASELYYNYIKKELTD